MNGVLEFYDTSDATCMNQAEHFMATDVEWDPTGRFVATSVSWWAHKVSNFFLSSSSLRGHSRSSHVRMDEDRLLNKLGVSVCLGFYLKASSPLVLSVPKDTNDNKFNDDELYS